MPLPPNPGNQKIDSDIEDFPDDLNENTVNLFSIFEPAGKVEVIDVNKDDFASASSLEAALPERRKTSTKLWKKVTIFDKVIPVEPLGNFADACQHLLVHSHYEPWLLFVSDNLLSTIVNGQGQAHK